jgi:hypothetical protein
LGAEISRVHTNSALSAVVPQTKCSRWKFHFPHTLGNSDLHLPGHDTDQRKKCVKKVGISTARKVFQNDRGIVVGFDNLSALNFDAL